MVTTSYPIGGINHLHRWRYYVFINTLEDLSKVYNVMAIGKNPNNKRLRNNLKIDSKKVSKIIADPSFRARMAKVNTIPIIRKFDVPYLAGSSTDNKKIYFDRQFNFNFNGKDISKYIRLHEVAEKAIMEIFRLPYQEANHIATHLEKLQVEADGINWNRYCDHIDPYIKQVRRDHLSNIPADLDLSPYNNQELTLLNSLKKTKSSLHETKISLEYHDELNPKLWDGPKLKSEVKSKLLSFAYAWANFAKIPQNIILDVIMTGGNANYNYTPQSDIDVHLVIDRNALGSNREFVDEYLQDKKVLWTLTHNIKILGYAIEPYAQDNGDSYPANQGVYSLMRSQWVQFPTKGSYDWKNDPGLKRKVLFYKRLIDQIIRDKMDLETVKDLKKKIRDMRGASIAKGGEFSFENLVFKELRNRGYLDKMNRYELSLKDKELSL